MILYLDHTPLIGEPRRPGLSQVGLFLRLSTNNTCKDMPATRALIIFSAARALNRGLPVAHSRCEGKMCKDMSERRHEGLKSASLA